MSDPFSEWKRARQIVIDLPASRAIDAAELDYDRFDELWRGIEWYLARNPDNDYAARRIVGSICYHVYRVDPHPSALLPAVAVLYTFSIHSVTIHDVRCEEASPAGST